MSNIKVAREGDFLTIRCVRSRETIRDIQEIDVTELKENKRYNSYVKTHRQDTKDIDKLLYFEPIILQLKSELWNQRAENNAAPDGENENSVSEEESETVVSGETSGTEEELPPALFVMLKNGKIIYGYMEQDRIYKLLVGMKYKVMHISVHKRYLRLGMLAYLTNTSEEQIERVRFVIDEKNQEEAPLKVEREKLKKRKVLMGGYYHHFKIPIENLLTDETQINNMLNIVVTVNGVDLEFRIGKKQRKKKSKRMYYAPYDGCYHGEFAIHLRRTDRGNFAIVKRPMEPIEHTLWFKFMESRPVSCIFYHLGKFVSKYSRKKVSLFYEKFSEKAEEGTFDLFEIASQRNNSKCYYIIDKNSTDYERIKDTPNVVKKYSLKYYWLVYRVNSYISTEAPAHLNIIRSNNKYFRMATCEHPFVFLQHGITYLKCQGAGSTFAVGKEGEPAYMIVGSGKEQDVVSDMLNLPEERLLNTGLPIFSKVKYGHINQETEDKVVIMLTWKSYEEHIQEFENSQYYQNVMAVYHMLTKYIAPEKIIIVPHPKMAELLENTSLKDTMWSRPISEVLSVAKLLITDYSSVCYNSFYQGGAVIFYQPDLELYEREVGELIPTPEEYIGERVFDLDSLEQTIAKVILDGQIQLALARSKEHEKQYQTINEYSDGKNIERIAEELIRYNLI